MAENSLQNQKNEVSFALSDNARAIIEKFEDKLQTGKYIAEQKNGIRAELVWQLLAKQYPETVCKVEETMAAAESEKHNVESPLKGLMSQFGDSPDVFLAMGLFDLHAIRLQNPICDLVDPEQIKALCIEIPAVVDYYFYVIVKYDTFMGSNDKYSEFCVRFSANAFNMRMMTNKKNNGNFDYPLCFVLAYLCRGGFSVFNNKEFDLVILDNNNTSEDNPCSFKWAGDTYYIEDFVPNYLSNTGQLFYKSSATSINRDSWFSFRKWAVENKLLQGVIQLRDGQILVISKQPAISIYFVDACKDFVKDDKLDVDKLIEVFREKNSDYYIEVSFEEFVSHNSQFYTFVGRQFAQHIVPMPKEGEVVVELRDLVDLYESKTEEDVHCFFLNRKYYLEDNLGSSSYEPLEAVMMPQARRVPKSDFFLFKWDEYSETFICAFQIGGDSFEVESHDSTGVRNEYDSEHNPIICTYPDAIIFKLKENPIVPIDSNYLERVLNVLDASDEVISQMELYKLPYSDVSMDEDDFLSIKVAIPSLEQQLRIMNPVHQQILADTKEEIQKNYEAYKQDIRMKKHALAQRLRVMKNWWQNLQTAREEGNGLVDDKAIIGKLHPISVIEIYSQIDREMNMLFKQVNAFNLGDTMTLEVFDAKEFVQQYVKQHDPMFEYQCEFPQSPTNIRFPKEALQVILDNIASNACSHGFKGRENELNIIRLVMEIKRDDLIVRIGNNGNPMSSSMTSEKVFTYGETTEEGIGEHGGLGGFQVKDLMSKFGNIVELELDENAEFPVVYKLVFRDVNIYK